jgi:tRNA 5-methylaminomethyl-2-thiouridine biosynthesis bifunctional protein
MAIFGHRTQIMSSITPATIHYNEQGTPVSDHFGDVYFSNDSGLLETEYVFLQHNGLPQRWSSHDRRHFHIIETGFGTGLNFLVTLQHFVRFLAQIPTHERILQRLYFTSTEKFPLRHADLANALASWPQLAAESHALLAQYPNTLAGCHRLYFADGAVVLDLWLGDILDTLPALAKLHVAAEQDRTNPHPPNVVSAHYSAQGVSPYSADAWYLDGFAPSKNPQMWQDELFQSMAALSRAGTTVATFTSAGLVRRGLQQAGFVVQKTKGFGRKREMAMGMMPAADDITTTPPSSDTQKTWLIVGAGLAGLTTALHLVECGLPPQVELYIVTADAEPGMGASHNRQGALYPQLHSQLDADSQLHLHCFAAANRFYQRWHQRFAEHGIDFAMQACGVLQLACNDKLALRQQKICQHSAWPEQVFQAVDAKTASSIAGITVPFSGLYFADGGWVAPKQFCHAAWQYLQRQPRVHCLSQAELVDVTRAQASVESPPRWQLQWRSTEFDKGAAQDSALTLLPPPDLPPPPSLPPYADKVLLAAGAGLVSLPIAAAQGFNRVRGQVSHVDAPALAALRTVICHQGYITPQWQQQHCVGASFDRDTPVATLKDSDDTDNLALVNQVFAEPDWFQGAAVVGRKAGLRCTVPGHIPKVGAIQPDLYVFGGLGARGLLFAPLLSQHLAAELTQQPSPLSYALQQLIQPKRA